MGSNPGPDGGDACEQSLTIVASLHLGDLMVPVWVRDG